MRYEQRVLCHLGQISILKSSTTSDQAIVISKQVELLLPHLEVTFNLQLRLSVYDPQPLGFDHFLWKEWPLGLRSQSLEQLDCPHDIGRDS